MSMTQAGAGYFEQVAAARDSLRTASPGEAVRDAAISRAYLRPEMVVADVGSGSGFMAAGLAPLVAKVYAVDSSAAMLDACRRNLAGFSNVELRLADRSALPFADGSLDAVFANMDLHRCPDPQAAVAEMVRVLKPGGRLVALAPALRSGASANLTDPDRREQAGMPGETADTWLESDRNALKGWLRAAGLVNVIVDCAGQDCRAASQDDPAAAGAISLFLATGSRRVSGARAAVQSSYGALAMGGGCCGSMAAPDCCSPSSNAMDLVEAGHPEVVLYDTGYTAEQIALVPAEAANLSLGCGNPTALAALRPGETVLDIGSGAGIDAFYAARRVGPQGRVIGLDMTPAMIERARRSAAAAGLSQVEFRLGQAEAMPVEDGAVDVILSNCVINLAEDKGRVFEEAYRVLKPGGRLSISDMVTAGPLPMSLRSDPRRWADCIYGALPERAYLDLVRQAGFVDEAGQRDLSGGQAAGVEVYSLSVTARKP